MSNVVHAHYPQRRPNALWWGASAMTMGLVGTTSKLFLNLFNSVETVGLDNFLKLVESREDPLERQRGLITGTSCIPTNHHHHPCANSWPLRSTIVSNHISV